MVARKGELRPSQAARLLGVHYRTVMRWAHDRLAGEASPILHVRRDVVGGYYLQRAEVEELASREVRAVPPGE